SQEELKMMISLVKPRFFIPIHGEYRHLILHQKLAQSLGLPPEHTFVLEDGDILELDHRGGMVVGKVPTGHVYVDGLGVGDVGPAVLRDRRHLSRDGVVIVILTVDEAHELLVSRPEVVSRGFVEAKGAEALMARSQEVVMKALGQEGGRLPEEHVVVQRVRDALGRFLYEQTKRRPMILPVTVTVGV
ncbi:MAG: ribonuclease J, partial [Chloroflexota bacterium]|nr:ribonuclease J [Chloroflexota bacterium]